jgi:hypothetical protein
VGTRPEACSLLASFAASLPLRMPAPIATTEMAAYLLACSEGTIGELAALLTSAATAAIQSGEESVSQGALLLADYAGPVRAPGPVRARARVTTAGSARRWPPGNR